jgi:hypothetical protein
LIAASWPALVRIPTASATREMAFCHPLRPTPTPKLRCDDTVGGLPNPPGCVGRKLVAAAVLELVDRLHQAAIGVSGRFETIEARIEVLSRRTDDEIEQRHKLAERLSNLERSV